MLHGKDSIVTQIECTQLIDEIMEWKQNAEMRLGVGQAYLANYTKEELSQWTMTSLRNDVWLLGTAAKNFTRTLTRPKRQHLITKYMKPSTLV